MKYKWYNEIIAWAEGKPIEFRGKTLGTWEKWVLRFQTPPWDDEKFEFRIKTEPHKFQYLVDAVNAGKTIQYLSKISGRWTDFKWIDNSQPSIHEIVNELGVNYEWRIKPDDIVRYGKLTHEGSGEHMMYFRINSSWSYAQFPDANIKMTFDGDTQQLKNVEFIKE